MTSATVLSAIPAPMSRCVSTLVVANRSTMSPRLGPAAHVRPGNLEQEPRVQGSMREIVAMRSRSRSKETTSEMPLSSADAAI